MKILLLAYACEPNRGSEPGIGWKWALQLAKNSTNEVFVLTRKNNQNVIEEYWQTNDKPTNLHFFYTDLGKIGLWAKHHGMSVNLYYALWLRKACDYAKKLNDDFHFDVAHHITFGVFRDASMLYKLGIPYVLGPVGGGEYTPKGLMSLYTPIGKIKESIRRSANSWALRNPLLKRTFNGASLILTKTSDTKTLLSRWANKTEVKLELGLTEVSQEIFARKRKEFLFVGRFIEWKGVELVLMSFYKYNEQHKDAHLTLIGEGSMQGKISRFRTIHGLDSAITILPWMLQAQLKEYYQTSTALIFPSLHDSSGNVVLEALSNGLPVICLDCGGPACVKGNRLKLLTVDTKDKSINDVINGIVEKMSILEDENILRLESEASLDRAKDFLWETTVNSLYNRIERMVVKKCECA